MSKLIQYAEDFLDNGGEDLGYTLSALPKVDDIEVVLRHQIPVWEYKGMTQEEAFLCGNPRAKSLVYLMSSNCMKRTGEPDKNGVAKARSPYRNVYEETKAHYETVRPEWTPGHRNSAALRKCSKEILKDLWIAAKADLAEESESVQQAA